MTTRTRIAVVGSAVALLPALLAGGALAAHHSKKVSPQLVAAKNKQQKKTLVDNTKGRTLYVLAPETSEHLLCTSGACLSAWPPLLIPAHTKPVAGKGVSGKLGTVKRGKKLQVTLRGMPLYTFAGDAGRNQVSGEGIVNFGGTWHTAAAKAKDQDDSHGTEAGDDSGGSGTEPGDDNGGGSADDPGYDW